jgi:hypothetical protein
VWRVVSLLAGEGASDGTLYGEDEVGEERACADSEWVSKSSDGSGAAVPVLGANGASLRFFCEEAVVGIGPATVRGRGVVAR